MLKSWQPYREFQKSLKENPHFWCLPHHRQRILYHAEALVEVRLLILGI